MNPADVYLQMTNVDFFEDKKVKNLARKALFAAADRELLSEGFDSNLDFFTFRGGTVIFTSHFFLMVLVLYYFQAAQAQVDKIVDAYNCSAAFAETTRVIVFNDRKKVKGIVCETNKYRYEPQ